MSKVVCRSTDKIQRQSHVMWRAALNTNHNSDRTELRRDVAILVTKKHTFLIFIIVLIARGRILFTTTVMEVLN